jgi:hypothetical protein
MNLRHLVVNGVEPRNQYEKYQLALTGPLLLQEWYLPREWDDDEVGRWQAKNPNIVQTLHLGVKSIDSVVPAHLIAGFDHCPVVVYRLSTQEYFSSGSDWSLSLSEAYKFTSLVLPLGIIEGMGKHLDLLPLRLLESS